MTGRFVLLVHPQGEVLDRLAAALTSESFKVMAVRSEADAVERLGNFGFFMPDVVLLPLNGGDSVLLEHLRSNPLTEQIPVVVLASGDGEERRRLLRLGLTTLVPPPYDAEELILSTRLALERHRDERLVSGSLSQLTVPDLLQTAEAARRSGTIVLKSRGATGTLWLRAGRVVDAAMSDGRRGRDAVFELALWTDGTFEADFNPISVPERINESTSFLLLEAMRRRDEALRDEVPPHAAMPDPPPPPPPDLAALHRGLTLLNVAAAYASNYLEASLLEQRLERIRGRLAASWPFLGAFLVATDGRVAVRPGATELAGVAADQLVPAVGSWLRDFFTEMENALPGRFPLRRLRALTEAIKDDLSGLGYYRALGLETGADHEETR